LNDANRILFKRNEIALTKHSNDSHFSYLYVPLIYIYNKKSLADVSDFADKLFLTTKEHTQNIWQASSR